MHFTSRPAYLKSEIEACAKMYHEIAANSYPPPSLEKGFKSLYQAARTGKFVRLAFRDDVLVGWVMAAETPVPHIEGRAFIQQYLCNGLKGYAAIKLLYFLHEIMEEEAERIGCGYIMSAASAYNASDAYTRAMGKAGWHINGYMCVKLTSHWHA